VFWNLDVFLEIEQDLPVSLALIHGAARPPQFMLPSFRL
jgi:hypothetical protein